LRWAVLAGVSVLAFAVPAGDGAWARITVLDVGDATATMVRTRAHVLVYGVGDAYAADGALVDRILVPALRAERVRVIDRVVLGRSSAHGSPGLRALLAAFPVVHTGLPRGPPLDFAGAERCSDVSAWSWDGIAFETAGAGAGCTVRISAGGRSVLLVSEGEPPAGASGANIAVVRSARGAPEAQMTVLSAKHAVARASWLSTATSGAVQFSVDAQRGLSPPIEWRRLRSGPWRITPEVAPFGL